MVNGKFHILIVDDTPKNIQVVATLLQNDNYSIAFASSGKSAIEMSERKEYDLILLDVMMPELDGFDTCIELKKIPHNKEVPIIFLTAKTDEESILTAFKVGGVDYITKPFNSSELVIRVKTHLDLKYKTESLLEYQHNLEDKIQDGVAEIKKKNEMLIQQSKMAAMGEMIGIIAHQWKQPLNSISLLNQNLLFSYKTDQLTEDVVDTTAKKITENLSFMSTTIDNFRNFFKPNKDKTEFFIHECIKSTLNILYAPFKKYRIDIEIIGEDIKLNTYKSELQQVLLNIISNAKDVLVEKKVKEPKILVIVNDSEDKIFVDIEDNGGGISEDIKDKIFDIYFSTKGDNGTGIGLYMVKMIIDESIKGKISVSNTQDGAKFTLEIPKR
jgi:DNA-binding response OmpR family regulator